MFLSSAAKKTGNDSAGGKDVKNTEKVTGRNVGVGATGHLYFSTIILTIFLSLCRCKEALPPYTLGKR